MSEKGEKRPVAVAEKTPATAVKQEPVFQIEKLRAKSIQLFGVTTSTFDGAFHGNKKKEMSVKEAQSVINKWLGKE